MARICGNPRSASGSVPGPGARSDVAAIGFSDNGYGALTCPALTTVHIDAEADGRQGARSVLGLDPDPGHSPGRVDIRESA